MNFLNSQLKNKATLFNQLLQKLLLQFLNNMKAWSIIGLNATLFLILEDSDPKELQIEYLN